MTCPWALPDPQLVSRVSSRTALCAIAALTGPVRTHQSALILGAPAHQFDFDAFNRFVFECATDERFTSKNLLPLIETTAELSWFEKNVYRFIIIPQTRTKILDQKKKLEWQDDRPIAGPGRSDAF